MLIRCLYPPVSLDFELAISRPIDIKAKYLLHFLIHICLLAYTTLFTP